MQHVNLLRESLPEAARDLRLNVQSVLEGGSLTPAQRWGTAVTCAYTTRSPKLIEAVLQDATGVVDEVVLEDARAAAAIMGMNNVYYRFRHLVGKPEYSQKPARLRMNALAKPRSNKLDFELFCLAASAINGCEACIQSHEKVLRDGGISDEQIHDSIRIAATLQGTAVALLMS